MDEYIKKESVIKEFTERLAKAPTGLEKVVCDMAIRIITKIPSADVQIVKHGKWEQGKCTNCEKSLEDLFSGDFYWDDDELHFCPNCGARMDLKDGDTE